MAGGFAGQHGFGIRFDWGPDGLRALAPDVDAVVIVDVLRFTTAVTAALEAGATILPYRWKDDGAAVYAEQHGAVLARRERGDGPSLSPTDLLRIPAGTRVVLPSQNGSALAFLARELGVPRILAGSLRNATATARALRGTVAVIAAGERWADGDGLRPALEDLLGAGAVIAALEGTRSPEAEAAATVFLGFRDRLLPTLRDCASGRERLERSGEDDVAAAAALDAWDGVAELDGPAFVPKRAPESPR